MDLYTKAVSCRDAMIQRATWILGDKSEAALIADEILADFAEANSFDPDKGDLRVYLRTAAKNRAIDYQKKVSRAQRTTKKSLSYCFACPRNLGNGRCSILGSYKGMVRDCTRLGYKYSVYDNGHYGRFTAVSLDAPTRDRGIPDAEIITSGHSEIADDPRNEIVGSYGETLSADTPVTQSQKFARPLNKQELVIFVLNDLRYATVGMLDIPLNSQEIAETYNRTAWAGDPQKPITAENVRYHLSKLSR